MKTDIKGFSNRVGLLSDLELSTLLKEHKKFIKNKVEEIYGKEYIRPSKKSIIQKWIDKKEAKKSNPL